MSKSKESDILSGPQRKFCEGIVAGLKKGEAYRAAYPNTSAAAAGPSATALLKNPKVKAEIDRLRAKADTLPGSAVLTRAEKREFCARVVRAQIANLPHDSDLFVSITHGRKGVEYKLPDKLAAIKMDNDLAGEGSEAEANDALAALLGKIRK